MPGVISYNNGWPVVNLGRLDKRIDIQKVSDSVDSLGQPLSTWNTVLSLWAAIESPGNHELMSQVQITSETTHIITILFQPGGVVFAPDMRIRYRDNAFRIQNITNLNEKDVAYQILCQELSGVS